MKRLVMLLGIAAAFALTWASGMAQGPAKQAGKNELLFVSSAQAKFTSLMPGVSKNRSSPFSTPPRSALR